MLVELKESVCERADRSWFVNPAHVVCVTPAISEQTWVTTITGRDNRGSIGNTLVAGKVGDIAAKLNAARDR